MKKKIVISLLTIVMTFLSACTNIDDIESRSHPSEKQQQLDSIQESLQPDNQEMHSQEQESMAQESQNQVAQHGQIQDPEDKEKSTNALPEDIEIVPAQVQVHLGWYRDERQQPEEFRGPRSESTLIYCVVFVENVMENSFSFDMREVVYSTQEVTEFISNGTAYFIEDGKKAVYYGEDVTLYFCFGDDQIDPIIGCMTIIGMEKLENIRYLNTDIPGHEAN